MRKIKKHTLRLLAAIPALTLALMLLLSVHADVPDSISVYDESDTRLCSMPHVSISIKEDNPADATARLWGVIPIKTLCVTQAQERELIVCGTAMGIQIYTKGVVVVETGTILSMTGIVNPGKNAGILPGDIIERIDGVSVGSTQDVIKAVTRSGGEELSLFVRRGEETLETELAPVYSTADGCYKAALWVRDSSAGIGMLTFIDPETRAFGGLGHAICDYDSGCVLPVEKGEITSAGIIGVTAGTRGVPGEMLGCLSSDVLGVLSENCSCGVFGTYTADLPELPRYKVGLKQSVYEGEAQIYLTLPGGESPEKYDILIEKICYNSEADSRNMIIRVTDPRLLDATGGIVQGMSGSPIVQNERIIGAVTHVFVNDPTQGYGIFIENMLNAAG